MEPISRRERKKRATKARILKKSRQIFEGKGYDNASIEDIAEAVDISKTTLFNYFASKESLLVAIADEAIEEIKDFIFKDLEKEPSYIKKIILLMERIYYDSIKYIHLNSRILFSTFPESGQAPSKLSTEFENYFSLMVKDAIANKELPADIEVEDIVRVIMITIYGLIVDCYSRGHNEDAQHKFDLAVDVLLKRISFS